MYPSTSLFIAFGQLAIVILVLFSYPLQVHPCRNCLDKVFHAGYVHLPVKTATDNDENDDEVDDEHTHTEMSTLKHTLLTSAIIACGFTIAYIVDDLRLGACQPPLIGCLADSLCSAFFRRVHWIYNYFFYSSGAILLEGGFITVLPCVGISSFLVVDS